MSTHGLQGGNFRHTACGSPEDGIQDHGKVYDVTHHASNILLAGERLSSQLATFLCVHLPASISIVNPICELLFRYIPVTIGNHFTGHFYLLKNTLTSAVHHQSASPDLWRRGTYSSWIGCSTDTNVVKQLKLQNNWRKLTLRLSYRFHILMISTWTTFRQLLRGCSAKSRLDQRLRQYSKGIKLVRIRSSVR